MREKQFWVVFGSVGIALSILFYFGAYNYLNGAPFLALFLSIVVLFVLVIPVARTLARKFEKVTSEKTKKWYTVMAVGLAVITSASLVFSLYDEYRVKSLDHAFDFQPEKALHLQVDLSGEMYIIEDKQAIAEWKTFLNQYEVKKMNDRKWNADVSNEQGFMVSLIFEDNWTGGSVYENRLINYGDMDYYQVLNGPVDIAWVTDFVERNQSLTAKLVETK
ncbi:hypothetical protein LG275_08085 [Chryseomicrobium palamuruense]